MRFSLRRKIITIACGATIIPFVAMFIITSILEDRLEVCMKEEVKSLIESHISQLTSDLYEECRTSAELLTDETERASMALQSLLQDRGRVEVLNSVSRWPVNNHRTEGKTDVTIPVLTIGGKKLVHSERKKNPLPILTEASRISGAYCTIFQRLNPEGDMLVVDTTAPSKNENPTIGDIQYSLNDSGQSCIIIDDILSGRTVKKYDHADHGTRFVVYSPLRNQDNYIIGMIAVHMEDNIVKVLRKSMLKTTIGKTGYVWAIGTKGESKGKYIVSNSAKDDGEHVDSVSGKKGFVDGLIEQAVHAGEGKLNSKQYLWKTENDESGRMKLSVFTFSNHGAGCLAPGFIWMNIKVLPTDSPEFLKT